jgi:alpha-tubulin suppressor-like RCC1 family protein
MDDRTQPTAVSGGLSFGSVAAGGDHTCGIEVGGAGHCWGNNDEGQLGDGSTTDESEPAAISDGLSFVLLTGGGSHSCGLTDEPLAYCWGSDSAGQIATERPDLVPFRNTPGRVFQQPDP